MTNATNTRTRKRDRLKARAKRYMTVPLAVRTADLPKRVASAAVMLAVAGAALWAGGAVLTGFIALVALACFVEFVLLVLRATPNAISRTAAIIAGSAYIGGAGLILASSHVNFVIAAVGVVIFVDTFAYFFGRAIGGPKIAPRISPSKTWAGLLGGVIGASLFLIGILYVPLAACQLSDEGSMSLLAATAAASPFGFDGGCSQFIRPELWSILSVFALGAAVAILAQAGDFFESWLKRRAGKKDSSNLIPGHGGVFDRVDGLLPVALLLGLFVAYA